MGFGKYLRLAVTGPVPVVCTPELFAIIAKTANILSPVKGLTGSIIDNVFRKTVYPVVGSILYCDLTVVEHSGVFIGDDRIVHLDGSGLIEEVTPDEFLNRLGGFNQAISIYVSCNDINPVGMKSIADRAKKMINSKRDYNLFLDNCHQFTSGCLTNDFENCNNFLWMLKDETSKKLKADTWRVWEREYAST